MKNFLCLVAAVVICIAVWKLLEYGNNLVSGAPPPTTNSPPTLPPQDPKIEEALADARKKGPAQFKNAINLYATKRKLKDPWLAQYQMDYMIMISINDPLEVTKIFQEIWSRTPADSPLQERLQALKKAFQPSP